MNTGLAAAMILRRPLTSRAALANELEAQLYAMVANHRPSDFTAVKERHVIDTLIEQLASLEAPWKEEQLSGTWRLSYLQLGPTGVGVDRRIPFPEFPGNDSYQVFERATVTNIGEVLGPKLCVRVKGSLEEENISQQRSPKRFRADITRGEICVGGSAGIPNGGMCAPLPISGVGYFDGVYLGESLRIGQNLNGGGARIVQVRVGS